MLTEAMILDLYRKCATVIPEDIESALKVAKQKESDKNAASILDTILDNIKIAKSESRPICQDTGTPFFYISHPKDQSEKDMIKIIGQATKEATEKIPLRPNAVDPITGINIGNKPVIHFEESAILKINLLMKGGGSENISSIYSLPDTRIIADRDISGIKRCVMDAVFRAQGKGCPPYIIGVAAGGSIEEVASLSKRQLLTPLDDTNPDETLDRIEKELKDDINRLGIGPMGLGGKTTALGVKMTKCYRNPPSFFVGISFGCWATRRASYD
ncbi:MAG: fumarate hydratase [archaeon]